jgi:hypothetical protein
MTNIDAHAVVSTAYGSWSFTISVPAEVLPLYAPAHVAWHEQLGGVPRNASSGIKGDVPETEGQANVC